MMTIQSFERALGRKALWAPRLQKDEKTGRVTSTPVHRLRIYPHALREANAYYSPDKKGAALRLLSRAPGQHQRVVTGWACFYVPFIRRRLRHETTHALLDGLHRYFAEPSNPDVLAFHEAFADVVALSAFLASGCSRIRLPKRAAISPSRICSADSCASLARRSAIGVRCATPSAVSTKPSSAGSHTWPTRPSIRTHPNPHLAWRLLVAAMFDAFLAIYKSRIADLLALRRAEQASWHRGEIHPDLVNRLANEASKTAGHVLRIAIRALDYCPPVDVTFGEYLRAIVTADADLVPDDPHGYRIAFIEAFRRRGIYPRSVRTLSPDALHVGGTRSRRAAARYRGARREA